MGNSLQASFRWTLLFLVALARNFLADHHVAVGRIDEAIALVMQVFEHAQYHFLLVITSVIQCVID